MKRLRWDPERSVPKRPYRDSALLYAVLAGIVVLVGLLTGASAVRTVAIAAGAFVLATGWSWWRWRERLRSSEGKR